MTAGDALRRDLLWAPADYWAATPEERGRICNGAGPRNFGWLVPDTVWGLSITPAANIHDWMYHTGKSLDDKRTADWAFLDNMRRLIAEGSVWLAWLRQRRALKYYWAVKIGGDAAFWSGKT